MLLLGVIATALAGLANVRTTKLLAVVAVVDVSESVRKWGGVEGQGEAAGRDVLERVRGFLSAATGGRGPDDLLGLVVFDGRASALAAPSRGEVLQQALDVRMSEGTNLAEALRLARAMIPPDAAGRLVLVSDGVANLGETQGAIDELASGAALGVGAGGGTGGGTGGPAERAVRRARLPVDVLPVVYDVRDEVVVESVDLPPTASVGATVGVRVSLTATGSSRGVLRLYREGVAVRIGRQGIDPDPNGRRIELAAGPRVELIEVPLVAGRVHRFRAVYEPDPVEAGGGVGTAVYSGDTLRDNNTAEGFTIASGKGNVLLLDGVSRGADDGAGSVIARAMRSSGIEVSIIAPEAMPDDLLSLEAFDLVMLENVGADAIPPEAQSRLAAYVTDLGGGLVMIGGPDAFASGGWRGTPIEPLLPVRLDLADKLVAPEVATIFVIDNSGSMAWPATGTTRSKQDIVNEATAMAIAQLERTDLVSVIVFNSRPSVVIPLARNSDPEASARRVREVGSDGGTNIGPALDLALKEILASDAKQKHVIVLSDGRSQASDTLAPRVSKMANAGVRVSTIAVGQDADAAIMEQMAQIGKGTFYPVLNATILPRIFLKAVRLVRTPRVREGEFQPVVTAPGSPLLAGIGSMPPLNGLSITRRRVEPTIVTALSTPEGEPVLAHWNTGLGKVAVFTSDAHRWAAPWLEWPGYAQFWSQLVRQIGRPGGGNRLRADAQAAGGEIRIRVEADPSGGGTEELPAEIEGSVFTPSGRQMPLRLVQTAPAVYSGAVESDEPGSYIAVAKPTRGGRPLPPAIVGATVPAGPELRTLRSNETLLRSIAAASGGRVLNWADPKGAAVFDRSGIVPRQASTSLWRWMLGAALATLLADIACRRVAWDRWTSREFGAGLAREIGVTIADRGQQARQVMESLRSRRDDAPASAVSMGGGSELQLSESDAKALAQAARDRRRRERLGQVAPAAEGRASVGGSVPGVASGGDGRASPGATAAPVVDRTGGGAEGATEGSGLLAAKRRARDRMNDPG